ncbi:hypothetical protein Pcinc_001124 [Petrolisthes cinctipes]|uniref:Uncharacterized protein n=1 Tax=Petrolisthes cinctipes TaxID=88211 RepID=A0AAE1GLN2_PETCI|nr:hypothetical protein Pcinc_002296 [Petrolisthes cinctipes]KAK3895158.1 hypothetical protein Pcinc_001124 [Petrolisthes cinctipes]
MGSSGSKSQRDQENGEALESQREHTGSINCMVLSEDGSLLVTGSDDSTACLWSAVSMPTECLGVLSGHKGRVTCVAVIRTYVFTGAEDSTIKKWDMCTSECLFTFTGHEQQVQRIICNGDFLLSTSYDKTVKVWQLEADEVMDENEICVRTLQGHTRAVYSVIFIRGANTGGLNEEGLSINPGDLVITGSTDSTARSWSLDLGVTLKKFHQHTGPITCMDADAHGRLLYTGSHDNNVIIWNINSGRALKTLSGHKSGITCIKVVNRLLYTGSADSKVKCWVREFGDCTRTYKPLHSEASVVCLKFDHGILFVGYTDHSIRAYDAKSGAMKRDYRGHTDSVNSLAISGGRLYSTSSDGTLRVWDTSKVSTDEELFQLSAGTRASRKRTAVSPMIGSHENRYREEVSSTTDESDEELENCVDIDLYIERCLGDDDVDPISSPAH